MYIFFKSLQTIKERVIQLEISIRKHIIEAFKDSDKQDFKDSIEDGIHSNDEAVLPGMGVFLEIIWENSNEQEKDQLLNILTQNIKK